MSGNSAGSASAGLPSARRARCARWNAKTRAAYSHRGANRTRLAPPRGCAGTAAVMIATKIFLTLVVGMVAAAMPFRAVMGQTKPDQKPGVIPPGLVVALQKDLSGELEPACLPWQDHVVAERFDLKPTEETWYVQGCGNDNWAQLLYVRRGNRWHLILNASGDFLQQCAGADPPCPVPTGSKGRSTSTRGWPDLELHMKGGAENLIRVQFNGKVYDPVGECTAQGDGVFCDPGWKLPK
jgi:hypothetical protein